MDVQTASGPALPLWIAVAAGVLALVLVGALVLWWRRPPRAPGPSAQLPPPGTYSDDDLPSFREHPPGFPGARPVPTGGTARTEEVPATGRDAVRAILIMALVTLLLIGAAAAVAATG